MKCSQSGLAPHRHRPANISHARLPQGLRGLPRLPLQRPIRTMAQGTSAEPLAAQQQQQQPEIGQLPAAVPQLQQQQPVVLVDGQPPPAMMVAPPALNPDGTPVSTATYMPHYPQGYPGMPVRSPQDMYMASPYAYPPPPPQAYRAEESSGMPWWLFVGIGVVVGGVLGKVQEFMKNPKSPQQMMTEMAMKQMMGAMGGPGAKPGGFPGGMPGGMPPGFPPGFPPSPPPPSAASATSTVDVPSYQTERKGEKFNSRFSSDGGSSSPSTSSTTTSTSSASSSEQDNARRETAATAETIEPIVKEPTSSSGGKKSASSFFADVASEDTSKKSSQSTGGQQPSGSETGATMSQMMEQMMRDPEMQKMLYPYLPEPMRNPSSIEWMLDNPEVKKQMSDMFESQNMMSPEMMEMMKSMNFNQDKVNAQFKELGLKPQDVISKVMANPELAAGFTNPKVQAAIMEITTNPMSIMKYSDQPEIMSTLEKITEVFQPSKPPDAR